MREAQYLIDVDPAVFEMDRWEDFLVGHVRRGASRVGERAGEEMNRLLHDHVRLANDLQGMGYSHVY